MAPSGPSLSFHLDLRGKKGKPTEMSTFPHTPPGRYLAASVLCLPREVYFEPDLIEEETELREFKLQSKVTQLVSGPAEI